MNAAVSAALSVVAKALAPVSGSLLEAWAASNELGPSIDSLKTELLYMEATLETSRGRQIDGPALEKLLQEMRDSAHNAEDVLDELDYFRIQDELYGTYGAAAKHAKGCGHNLVLNARHTTKALGKLLACSSAASPRHLGEEDAPQHCCAWPRAKHRPHDNSSSMPISNMADVEVTGYMRKLGKLFPCSSFPSDHDEDDSRKLILCGACISKAPHINQVEENPKLGFDRVHVSNRMKQIVEQLRSMHQEVSTILLGCGRSIAPDIAHSRPITTSKSVEPELYGRDLIMNSIIHDITKGKYCGKDLTVLPIVGAEGIGKTTQTQHIYHSQEIQIHFPVIIWVCVSLNFNPIKLLQEIEGKIPKVEGEKEGTTGELIEQRLRSRKFLLIMDDMWECTNEDDWKRLLLPLRKSQENGNVIIVTTRLPELAQMVKTTDHSIELGGLHPEEFRKLFLAFVFGDEQCKRDHILLLRTGDKIMEKLKGSPLAAKTVGRLLRNRLDLHHWRKNLESKEWETQSSEHDIMPALKLSYDYLPFHQQQCFSYCSLFPEDYKFDSKELIHLWIGLNILPFGCRNKTVEDIGLSNLNDLVTDGFFRKEKTSGHSYYIIHDLLHDLALRVASHECLSLHRSNVRSVEIFPSIRHLSIIIDSVDDNNMVENFKNELRKLKTRLRVENLQTLMLFGGMDKSFAVIFGVLFREANSFRVLCLPKMPDPVESMLHNFSALVHLQYLSLGTIRGSQVHLPNTISRFII